MLIGIASLGRALVRPGEPLPPFTLKGLLAVTVATLAFGFLVRGAGLVVAMPLLVIVSAAASTRFRWSAAITLAAGLTLFCAAVFVKGLGVPIPVSDAGSADRRVELVANLALGLQTAFTPANLLYCLVGVFLGTLIGVLPGLGPTATIAMLLPITFTLPPIAALIMLAGIYYGSQYGGSTTSILVNLPGEAASVVTTLDGYQMARQGRAGVALATAAIGSFFAGTVATFLIAASARPWRPWRCGSAPPSTSRSWCSGWSRRSCWRRARCCTPSAWWCWASCWASSGPT